MKEATRKQIEAMKAQTIGVEIEMYGITRQNAAPTTPREGNGSSRGTRASEQGTTKKNARW